ncbi:adipolin-like isoform X1 [Branchiostoma floridae x Branchiostoma belcheri]
MHCCGVLGVLAVLAVGCEVYVVAASKVRAVRSYREGVPVFDNDYYAMEHNETVITNEHDDEVFPGSLEVDKPIQVDPRGSWMSFVKHSNNGNKNNGRKKRKEQEKTLGLLSDPPTTNPGARKGAARKHGPPGPQGPPGPRGPAGPPGAVITKDEMFREFKEMVREAAERRALRLLQEKCPKCLNVSQHLGIWPYWDDTNSPPKLHDAFHCRLRGNVVIPRKTLMELKNFQTPFGGGAFVRGTGMNLREGRFTAHRPGVYHFSATLHIGHPRQKRLRPRDSVRALICINSLCQRHTSLEVVTGIESNSRVFTISVSGMLELQSGQYTSIFMDNSSKKPVTVQSGSDFTANFVGQ